MTSGSRRQMIISPRWMQGVVLTFAFGFTIMGYLTLRAYEDHPPIPSQVVSESGQVIITDEDILHGQEGFLTYGLMQFGSVYGHGAYLGPDFTADYLHRAALVMKAIYGGGLEAEERARQEWQANRYDPASGKLTWTRGQVQAFEDLAGIYEQEFLNRQAERRRPGSACHPRSRPDPTDHRLHRLDGLDRLGSPARPAPIRTRTTGPPNRWSATSLTRRPSSGALLSLIALLGGIGLVLTLFGRYSNLLGWHGMEERRLRFLPPGEVPLTPAQRSTAWYFLAVAALFLAADPAGRGHGRITTPTTGVSSASTCRSAPLQPHAHLARATGHLLRGRRLPGGRHLPRPADRPAGSRAARDCCPICCWGHWWSSWSAAWSARRPATRAGSRETLRSLARRQGWEYLDLGRLWQILLVIGMVLWVVILYRGLRGRLAGESLGNLPYLFFYSAAVHPAVLCRADFSARPQSNFAIADFWRFWVVHLWVEDFLELFTTIMVAYIFVLLGVVSEKTATRVIYFDVILYSVGGVVGTMHHFYFSGGSAVHMALGAVFSAGEVIPLTFLTVEAWSFLQLGRGRR